ncbi:MAG: PHP domain-containing protein [Anaeroplasma sp.]
MKIDLHNHTIHSDGVLTTLELLNRATENKVDVLAITDHDSVYACKEYEDIIIKADVKIIKGMELSTVYNGESVHIVCLFKNNIIPKEMLDFSALMSEKRRIRAKNMLQNISSIYSLKTDFELLEKNSQVITRANMLRHIASLNNISYKEAKFYISNESKAYIPSTTLTVEEGLKFAKSLGCIAIFAHPCLIKNRADVEKILAYGFDGIEVRYPSEKNDESYFTALAKKYNLLISAGSDCHGDHTHADIGTCTLNYEEFMPILDRLGVDLWK